MIDFRLVSPPKPVSEWRLTPPKPKPADDRDLPPEGSAARMIIDQRKRRRGGLP
jgi:hypothetical protein